MMLLLARALRNGILYIKNRLKIIKIKRREQFSFITLFDPTFNSVPMPFNMDVVSYE